MVLLTPWALGDCLRWYKRFYAIKDEKAIDTGTVISTVFAAIVAGGCYFLGGFGRLFSDQVDVAANGYDSIIPTMLSGLSDVLIAVVVILVLSASMSTLSSLVLASSSTLTPGCTQRASDPGGRREKPGTGHAGTHRAL